MVVSANCTDEYIRKEGNFYDEFSTNIYNTFCLKRACAVELLHIGKFVVVVVVIRKLTSKICRVNFVGTLHSEFNYVFPANLFNDNFWNEYNRYHFLYCSTIKPYVSSVSIDNRSFVLNKFVILLQVFQRSS